MRRADRLLALVEALRRGSLVTGRELAGALKVSLRTVYRDVAALIGIGIPIRGEAGVGYSLEPGYYLPPLNLTCDEAEALALALGMLETVGDSALRDKASSVSAKVRAVLSREARSAMHRSPFMVVEPDGCGPPRHDLLGLKRFIEHRRVLEIDYPEGAIKRTLAAVRPQSMRFLGTWYLLVRPEGSGDLQWLRLDHISRIQPTGTIFRT